MNSKAFIMPTILAFIIITSSALLYQSISVVSQLYSLKAEVNDLTKLEYAVNTKRIIASLEFKPKCKYQQQLDYVSDNSQLLIASNCIYTETEDEEYNQAISKLLGNQQLSHEQYQDLQQAAKSISSEVKGKVESELGPYTERYYLLFVEYRLAKPEQRIVVVDDEQAIVVNKSVK